jgi:anion-transporting  ArsA/GET3 family ATPase
MNEVVTRLPVFDRRLVIVTGKGGVGKSAVAMAIALAASRRRRRTLLVEMTATPALGERLGLSRPLDSEPSSVSASLAACRLDPREALETFIRSLVPIGLFARRLLGSQSFQTLVAAAPGIDEFLALYRLAGWEAERRSGTRRPRYDLIVVDAHATGHSLPLLSAPETFLRMVPVGPFADIARRLRALVADATRTAVAVVAVPEEMAVNETIELHRHLAGELRLPVVRPIVNAVPPERWSPAEERIICNGIGQLPQWQPFAAAVRFELARRRAAEAHIARLRSALGLDPVRLPYLFTTSLSVDAVGPLADALNVAATP